MPRKIGEEPQREGEKTIQQRAVEHGAEDVPSKKLESGMLSWPADEERVAIDKITYNEETDTFMGWKAGGNEAEWESK